MCIFFSKKIPLNGFDDNYCRGESHKSFFEDSLSECGGDTPVKYGLIFK